MKLKSLILGSVAAAGLSTAGYAADLGVLTSLDVCDSLGISGLTLSSSDNCLQISGGVAYDFEWGDRDIDGDGVNVVGSNDWVSEIDAWLDIAATSSTDFGPATAYIGLGSNSAFGAVDGVYGEDGDDNLVTLDYAYVSIGDTTMITVGMIDDSVAYDRDFGAEDFGFGDFIVGSDAFNAGIGAYTDVRAGGHVLQVVSTVGEGVRIGASLENLNDTSDTAGAAIGFVEYEGAGINAYLIGNATGILDGVVDAWAIDAGFSANFDNFNVGAQGFYLNNPITDEDYFSILGVAGATFDIFTIALDAAYSDGSLTAETGHIGGSIGATVTEGIAINLAANFFDADLDLDDTEEFTVAAQLVAGISETLELTTEVGMVYFTATDDSELYGDIELVWNPDGDDNFEAYVGAYADTTDQYSIRVGAEKEFQ
jgi:hypothetical protein